MVSPSWGGVQGTPNTPPFFFWGGVPRFEAHSDPHFLTPHASCQRHCTPFKHPESHHFTRQVAHAVDVLQDDASWIREAAGQSIRSCSNQTCAIAIAGPVLLVLERTQRETRTCSEGGWHDPRKTEEDLQSIPFGCGSKPFWYHFGVCAPPILVYVSGDWDVHWGYGLLTHGHLYTPTHPDGLRSLPHIALKYKQRAAADLYSWFAECMHVSYNVDPILINPSL